MDFSRLPWHVAACSLGRPVVELSAAACPSSLGSGQHNAYKWLVALPEKLTSSVNAHTRLKQFKLKITGQQEIVISPNVMHIEQPIHD